YNRSACPVKRHRDCPAPPTANKALRSDRSGPATATTGDVSGAAGAAPGLRPGEGVMREGLPHYLGGHRGVIPSGVNTEASRAQRLRPAPGRSPALPL